MRKLPNIQLFEEGRRWLNTRRGHNMPGFT